MYYWGNNVPVGTCHTRIIVFIFTLYECNFKRIEMMFDIKIYSCFWMFRGIWECKIRSFGNFCVEELRKRIINAIKYPI